MRRFIINFILILILAIVAPMTAPFAVAQEKSLWIDVRSQQEFNAGHLQGAVLIPYNQIAKKINAIEPNKRRRINLYCRSGRRAQIALQTLEQLGYISVQNRGALSHLRAQGIK